MDGMNYTKAFDDYADMIDVASVKPEVHFQDHALNLIKRFIEVVTIVGDWSMPVDSYYETHPKIIIARLQGQAETIVNRDRRRYNHIMFVNDMATITDILRDDQ